MNYLKSLLRNGKGSGTSIALATAIALAPKCPLCCAAYLGFFSSVGMMSYSFSKWLLPGLWTLLILNQLSLGLAAWTRRQCGPFIVSALGTVAILMGKVWLENDLVSWLGVALVLVASAWNLSTAKCVAPVVKERLMPSRD